MASSPRPGGRPTVGTVCSEHPPQQQHAVQISVPVPHAVLQSNGGSGHAGQPQQQLVYVPAPGPATPLSTLKKRPGSVACRSCGQTALTRTGYVIGNMAQ